MRTAITAACVLGLAGSLGVTASRAGDPAPQASATTTTSAASTSAASTSAATPAPATASSSPALAKADAAKGTPSQSQTRLASTQAPPAADKEPSRTCLTTTGSLIPPKPGHCVNAFGNVYTQDDLQHTGRTTAADALRNLSPIVTLVH
jgi:hypothetical protein